MRRYFQNRVSDDEALHMLTESAGQKAIAQECNAPASKGTMLAGAITN
jgi:hypothetical protein